MTMTAPIPDNRLAELLACPPEQWNLAWLQKSLQLAVELELATLPPYLCGYWSCKNSGDPVPKLINGVVLQEMFHMGLAANMLVAIGGPPTINTRVPTYPGPLPGGVQPELTVSLSGLTKSYVGDVYMAIEFPEAGPITPPAPQLTIGKLYGAISDALARVNPPFSATNQLNASIGEDSLTIITSVAEAQAAINVIKEQGEGTATSPDDSDGAELAHYYRFGEIFNGAQLIQTNGAWTYSGAAVPFPETYPMSVIPAGGWGSGVPANVAALLSTFDKAFTSVLDNLQAAWTTGSQDSLTSAVNSMFALSGPGISLMQIPVDSGAGTYGPDFLYTP